MKTSAISFNSYSLISKSYGLLSLGLLGAAIMAYLSLGVSISGLAFAGIFVGMIVLMFGCFYLKESILGFLCYAGFIAATGFIVGPAINKYLEMPNGSSIVFQAFMATASAMVGLSAYAIVSKKSFDKLGGFLFAGLIIVIIASISNIFIGSNVFNLGISIVSSLIFCGYILYDTSKIVNGEYDSPIFAAMTLFLDVFNLFLNSLQILGFSKD